MNRIHVVRDCGGLGDIVRITAVLDALRDKYPNSPINLYAPRAYAGLVMDGHCWGMDRPGCRYVLSDDCRFRPYRGAPLERNGNFLHTDHVIDLNCPAALHERHVRGSVTGERTALWAAAAGVRPRRPVIHCPPPDRGELIGKTVVIHTRPAGLIRQWPKSHWGKLINALYHPPDTFVMDLGLTDDLPWPRLIHHLQLADLVIAVDSGIFHLAAALGRPTLGLFGPTNGEIIYRCYNVLLSPSYMWLGPVRYLQAPQVHDCAGTCHAFPERGFNGGECLQGCCDLAALRPETVIAVAREMLQSLKPPTPSPEPTQ